MPTPQTYAARDWSLWSVTARLVVTEPTVLAEASGLVDACLAGVEQAASRFLPGSELSRLRPGPDGTVVVGPVLADLLAAALEAARETDGMVDPTLGDALAGLGYDRDLALLPPADATRVVRPGEVVVRRSSTWRSLRLDGRRLTLPAGVRLDLGATAKARAADRCAALVHDRLGTGVLVSLGGDVATAGPAPREGWQVTVQDLPADAPQQVGLTAGAAVATSSTARRTWQHDGRVVHHLLDPRTGAPVDGPWRCVTVVAPTCLRANTASTATLALGDAGLSWLARTGLPARLLGHDGGVVTTGGWPREVAA